MTSCQESDYFLNTLVSLINIDSLRFMTFSSNLFLKKVAHLKNTTNLDCVLINQGKLLKPGKTNHKNKFTDFFMKLRITNFCGIVQSHLNVLNKFLGREFKCSV